MDNKHAFYYLYKGPKTSLFPFYTMSLVVTPTLDPVYDKQLPAYNHLFDKRDWFQFDGPPGMNFGFRTITPEELNVHGNNIIKQKQTQLYQYFCSSFMQANIHITEVTKPRLWPEKLAVLMAVKHRNDLIENKRLIEDDRRSRYIVIEKYPDQQKKYLGKLVLLPDDVDWIKAMDLFNDVYPKPYWYQREIETYRRLILDEYN